jgi:hypothetical protein
MTSPRIGLNVGMQTRIPNAATTLVRSCAIVAAVAMLAGAGAAPLPPSPEGRYITTRDAAIEKISPIYDAGKFDDAAQKVEDAARADLQVQMSAILGELHASGFGPAKLNLETFYRGDEGFGMLDGLRLDAELGKAGEPAGRNGADGNYVEPKAHIIVTTQTMFERWLHAHKDWWDKGLKNVPQQIGAALRDESFYTLAISPGEAVVKFNILPVAKPASATFAYGFLAGRTQSDIPDAADQVFVSALANGKVYIAYGSVEPKVEIAACIAIRVDANKRAEAADEAFGKSRSTTRPMTGLATSASRAKTPISVVSPSAPRSNHRLSKQQGRRRRCWRRRWENNARRRTGPKRHEP